MKKIFIGVSSCLLGEEVRYDGGHKRDRYVTDILSRYFKWLPICPESEVGMGVPREAVRLVGDPEQPKMVGQKTGQDWTQPMQCYINKKMASFKKHNLSGYILKSKSPSCGMERVKIYQDNGDANNKGRGLFADALMEKFPLIPIEEEGRLNDPKIRENFITRVFGYFRLNHELLHDYSRGRLVQFHTINKYLILAHSPKHYSQLGQLVSNPKSIKPTEMKQRYSSLYMEALSYKTTTKKNVNVLQHIAGFMKRQLSPTEKKDIMTAIDDFKNELVPLVVPLTLIRHYTHKFRVDYIENQIYLNPHPKELMLRNHV